MSHSLAINRGTGAGHEVFVLSGPVKAHLVLTRYTLTSRPQPTNRDPRTETRFIPACSMLEGWTRERDPQKLTITEVLIRKSVGYVAFPFRTTPKGIVVAD